MVWKKKTQIIRWLASSVQLPCLVIRCGGSFRCTFWLPVIFECQSSGSLVHGIQENMYMYQKEMSEKASHCFPTSCAVMCGRSSCLHNCARGSHCHCFMWTCWGLTPINYAVICGHSASWDSDPPSSREHHRIQFVRQPLSCQSASHLYWLCSAQMRGTGNPTAAKLPLELARPATVVL